jgi:hypothetical protein
MPKSEYYAVAHILSILPFRPSFMGWDRRQSSLGSSLASTAIRTSMTAKTPLLKSMAAKMTTLMMLSSLLLTS